MILDGKLRGEGRGSSSYHSLRETEGGRGAGPRCDEGSEGARRSGLPSGALI